MWSYIPIFESSFLEGMFMCMKKLHDLQFMTLKDNYEVKGKGSTEGCSLMHTNLGVSPIELNETYT